MELPAQAFKEWQEKTQTWVRSAAAKSERIGTSAADIVATLPGYLNGTNETNAKNSSDWYTTLRGKPTVHDFEQLTGEKVPPQDEFVPGEATRQNTPREMQKHRWIVRTVTRKTVRMRTKDYLDKEGPEAKC